MDMPAPTGSVVENVSFLSWEAYLTQPKSALLFGLLSCAPCRRFHAALHTLDETALNGWRVGSCILAPKQAFQLIEQRQITCTPTFLAKSQDGRVGRIITPDISVEGTVARALSLMRAMC